ncbi:phage portal protein [Rhodovarius crocodyli]|uniref:Phage portal protein n=1 Tax=Rhodovarius crocodyli TaxID=1979269 RepID=A0A437M186_9PROT|nr:phage portal protein [Rhodovarius crocodyli]RVT91451.1 phage portal protein [Rhodovarius crocodyli]
MSSDDARSVATDPRAPAMEVRDAETQLTRASMPAAGDLFSPEVVDQIRESLDLLKAQNVIPFPGTRVHMPERRGMQSLDRDDLQLALQGGYYDRPGLLSPETMRDMVRRTPVLSAVVWTRQRQVARFCSPSEDGGLGFAIRHVDPKHELAPEEEASIARLTRFFQHCGFEWSPRKRKALKRDNFPTFMGKLVFDTLAMDAAAIETEMKRDRSLGIDGLYALDGSTIRLCTDDGHPEYPDAVAVQVVNGRVTTAYQPDALIYEPRNACADVRYGGYGFSETEVLVQTVTGFLNAMTLNIAGFEQNSIPRGMLHLVGDYGDAELAAFKRYWKQMTTGAKNAFGLPVMVNKDPDGKASFERFGVEFNEMYFSKWMTFLTSLICAIYGMAPDEINFESFTNGSSSLSGSDTTEKLAASKDKGLRPLLSYFEQTLTDFVVTDFSDKYCFRWIGLDERDQAREWEGKKLTMTVDELRAEQGLGVHPDPKLGAAPLNPALMTVYQGTLQQQPGQGDDFGGGGGDFGDPDAEGPGPGHNGSPGLDDDAVVGADSMDAKPASMDAPPPGGGDFGQPGEGRDFGKSIPLIYQIGGE